jgi:hypothetical protein
VNDADMRTRLTFSFRLVIVLSCALGISQAFGQVAHRSAASPNSADVATATGDMVTKVTGPPPTCPAAGTLSLQPGSPGTGDHKVTLSWNASDSPSPSENGAIGYCLYRSKNASGVRKNPTCGTCEQVNVVPVASLSCVDNVVEDGVTYYYVVTAINARSAISSASNEVKVPIGRGREEKTTSGSSPPLCRINRVAR